MTQTVTGDAPEHDQAGAPAVARPAVGRLASLDALRGFDMLWIIGGDALVVSVANLTHWRTANWAAGQMEHAAWHGFRFYDLIFPLFVFLSGVAMPFSLSRRVERGDSRRALLLHAVKRGVILVALGVVYNNGLFQMGLGEMRYPSVLGRIGLAYLGAAVIVLFTGVKGQARWLIGLLVGYWLALRFVPVPGVGAGHLTQEGSLVGWVDRALVPARLLLGDHDPEGVLSTLPAVGSALAGALCGHLLRRADWSAERKTVALLGAGAASVAAGAAWHPWLPVNKNLWTSSFVLVTAGLSMLLLGLFHYLIDGRGWQRWAFPLQVIGANSILIYLAGRVIDFGRPVDFFLGGLLGQLSEEAGAVVFWLGFLATEWVFLWFLYRRRLFLRV